MPNPQTFQISKEIIYLSKKLVKNSTYVHFAVLDQILTDWSETIKTKRTRASKSKSAEEMCIENKITSDLDYFCSRNIRMHPDLQNERINGLPNLLDRLDEIRQSRNHWPQSPNIVFWRSSLEAVKANWQEAIRLVRESIDLIEKSGIEGADIDASIVARLCREAYYCVQMGAFDEAQAAAFRAIARAEDLLPKTKAMVEQIKRFSITRDRVSESIPLSHLAACDVFIREGDWADEGDKLGYFNFHWQAFRRAGGFEVMSPPVMIAVLTDDRWRQYRPDIMSDLSRQLFLRVSKGSGDKVWRRTNLFLASAAAIMKGDMDVAVELPFGMVLIGTIAAAVSGGWIYGEEMVTLAKHLTREEIGRVLQIAQDYLVSGEDVASYLQGKGSEYGPHATGTMEIPPDVAGFQQLVGGEFVTIVADLVNVSSNGDTSERLT